MRSNNVKKAKEHERAQVKDACPRCGGAMIPERCHEMLAVFYAWRCLNCGEMVDPVVERNRAESEERRRVAG